MGVYRQDYLGGLPFSPQGIFPNPRIKPESLTFPAFEVNFFTTEQLGSPKDTYNGLKNKIKKMFKDTNSGL